jgi:phosphoribosyl-dephospho-CoA transferase
MIAETENLQVHDLVEIEPDSLAPSDESAPVWVRDALASCPWAAVRRAHALDGLIPVGIRGTRRYERWGTDCLKEGIREIVTPESLLDRFRSSTPIPRTPALMALCELVDRLSGRVLRWGPFGSAAFELATGQQVTTEASDLDLMIRVPEPMSRHQAQLLWQLTQGLQARADVLVETGHYGFSLEEYANPISSRILLRHKDGSRLEQDPWAVHSHATNVETMHP